MDLREFLSSTQLFCELTRQPYRPEWQAEDRRAQRQAILRKEMVSLSTEIAVALGEYIQRVIAILRRIDMNVSDDLLSAVCDGKQIYIGDIPAWWNDKPLLTRLGAMLTDLLEGRVLTVQENFLAP
jgi:hypothetical protein